MGRVPVARRRALFSPNPLAAGPIIALPYAMALLSYELVAITILGPELAKTVAQALSPAIPMISLVALHLPLELIP